MTRSRVEYTAADPDASCRLRPGSAAGSTPHNREGAADANLSRGGA
jgi:hypothetical protein